MRKRRVAPKTEQKDLCGKAREDGTTGAQETGEIEVIDRVLDLVPPKWAVQKIGTERHPFFILDSYDISLLMKGTALLEFPGNPTKIRLLPDSAEYKLTDSPDRNSDIADFLPSGSMKEAIRKCLGAWKLARQTEGSEKLERYRISNENQKGVARLYIRTYACSGGLPAAAAEVHLYRGCGDEMEIIGRNIEDLYPSSSIPHAIRRLFPETVRVVSTPSPSVHPEQEIREASLHLLQYLLARVRHYEPGIACHEDPEVLHRYRVTIRRMRSLVALLKTAFIDEERKMLGTELKAAMQGTGRLRDLDVQMAEMHEARSSLPEILRTGMDSLIHSLIAERGKESESVRKILSAASFEDRFSDTTAVAARRTQGGSGTVAEALSAAIAKRFRRIVREVQAAEKQSTPQQLHRLRVSCKKLRYLIDFFPQIFDGDIASLWIRKLKALQDFLGRYNDLAVQEVFLLSQETRHTRNGYALMAIGAVIMKSHRQRRRLAKRSMVAARRFCSMEIQRLLEGLTRREID